MYHNLPTVWDIYNFFEFTSYMRNLNFKTEMKYTAGSNEVSTSSAKAAVLKNESYLEHASYIE